MLQRSKLSLALLSRCEQNIVDEARNLELKLCPSSPFADSLTNSIKMLTRSDIILEKRVEANEDAARSEAEAAAREMSRLARGAAATRAAVDGALQNITAGVREGEEEELRGADFFVLCLKTLEIQKLIAGGHILQIFAS